MRLAKFTILLVTMHLFLLGGEEARADMSEWRIERVGLRPLPDRVLALAEDSRGLLYISQPGAVVEYDGNTWRRIVIPNGSTISGLANGPDGIIHVAGPGVMGVIRPNDTGTMTFIPETVPLPVDAQECFRSVFGLAVGVRERIYFCHDGLIVLGKSEARFMVTAGQVDAVVPLGDSFLVIDEAQGLRRLDPSSGKWIAVSQGEAVRTRAVLPLEGDRVLVAGLGKGILEFEGASGKLGFWETQGRDLVTRYITALGKITHGLVLGTSRDGLLFLGEHGETLGSLGREQGLPGMDIATLLVDREGTLWVGTEQGLVKIRRETTATQSRAETSFAALIRQIDSTLDNQTVFGGALTHEKGGAQVLDWSENNFCDLKPRQNALRFTFASNSLSSPEEMEYQTFLHGFDSEWTEWSDRTVREFTNLFWRNYEFEVRARKKNGRLSTPAIFHLRIATPWYETIWYHLGQFAVMGLLFLGAAYARGQGASDTVTKKLTGVFMSLLFGSIYGQIGIHAFVGTLTQGVGFIKLLTSAGLGLLLKPIEQRVERQVTRLKIDNSALKHWQGKIKNVIRRPK